MSRKRKFLDQNHIRVADRYEGEGDSPLFVLIPGLGAMAETLALVAAHLKAMGLGYLLLEPPGFGNRNPRQSGVLLGGGAALTHASGVLPTNRRVIYVGHSAGAMSALELATRDPNAIGFVGINNVLDDVSKVINRPLRNWWRHPVKSLYVAMLINYVAGWLPEFVLRRLETPGHWLTWLFRPLVARPDNLSREALHYLVRYNRCRSGLRQLLANKHYDYIGSAELLNVPALFISGQKDPLITLFDESDFVRGCRHKNEVTSVTLDTGHCTPVEAPRRVAEELGKFSANL